MTLAFAWLWLWLDSMLSLPEAYAEVLWFAVHILLLEAVVWLQDCAFTPRFLHCVHVHMLEALLVFQLCVHMLWGMHACMLAHHFCGQCHSALRLD